MAHNWFTLLAFAQVDFPMDSLCVYLHVFNNRAMLRHSFQLGAQWRLGLGAGLTLRYLDFSVATLSY